MQHVVMCSRDCLILQYHMCRSSSAQVPTCNCSDVVTQIPLLHDPLLGQEGIWHHAVQLLAEAGAGIHDDAPQV